MRKLEKLLQFKHPNIAKQWHPADELHPIKIYGTRSAENRRKHKEEKSVKLYQKQEVEAEEIDDGTL